MRNLRHFREGKRGEGRKGGGGEMREKVERGD